jgi:peroxiredoxin
VATSETGGAPERPSTRPLVAGKIGTTLLGCYLFVLALRIGSCYQPELRVRDDIPAAGPHVGERFPEFELPDFSGTHIGTRTLAGATAVLVFAPSLDWSPPTKAQLIDLAQAVRGRRDVAVAVILTEAQATPRGLAFARERQMPFYYLVDTDGVIERLGLHTDGPDGTVTTLPATFVLDRHGVVRLRDVRRQARTWLAPEVILDIAASLGPDAAG